MECVGLEVDPGSSLAAGRLLRVAGGDDDRLYDDSAIVVHAVAFGVREFFTALVGLGESSLRSS